MELNDHRSNVIFFQKIFLIFVGLFSFETVLAADSILTINWTVPPSDTTYQLLVYLFGTVSDDLVCEMGSSSGCNTLIPMLFNIFNQGVLGIGIFVISYVMFMAAGHSAQEGEFLGKRNSSLWVPVRITGGLSCLMPTYNGYSILQGLIMKVVLMGVAVANSIYGMIDTYVSTNETTFGREQINTEASSDMLSSISGFAKSIFPLQLCYAYYQDQSIDHSDPAHAAPTTIPEFSSGYPLMSGPIFYSCQPEGFFTYYYLTDAEAKTLQNQGESVCEYGSATKNVLTPQPTTSGTNICGYFQYKFNLNDKNKDATQTTLQTLEINLYQQSQLLLERYKSTNYTSLLNPNVVSDIQLTINDMLQKTTNDMITAGMMSQMSQEPSTQVSWLDFPLNFYEWLGQGSVPPANSIYGSETATAGNISVQTDPTYDGFVTAVNACKFFDNAETTLMQDTSSSTALEPPVKNSEYAPVKYMYNAMNDMMNSTNDPLISLAAFGQQLLKISLDILFSSIIIGGTIVSVTAICSCRDSFFATGLWMATAGFMLSIMLAFGFLIPMGVSLGIYLPLMPLLMYSFGALNWFMLVIEGMVAGPIIALGVVAPSQDTLGKAQPSVVMLFNLFLRPSLLVMGMVFGAKLFDLFVIYFSNVMMSGFEFIGELGHFGDWYAAIFILFWYFYSSTVLVVAQRSYAMIYQLPDRVLRWIGDQGGNAGSMIQQEIKTVQQSLTQGGEALQEEMSSTASGMLSLAQDVSDSPKKKN